MRAWIFNSRAQLMLDPTWRALVVAVLSLVMAEIGKACADAP